ncbi:MAG: hypothetical protein M1134_05440 [Actinobacteria bacterium]|nr:hypothetical protein [Actinomycetota bacterium]MCL5445561.1 hypothetical protein [Actinomycetota bacterium]
MGPDERDRLEGVVVGTRRRSFTAGKRWLLSASLVSSAGLIVAACTTSGGASIGVGGGTNGSAGLSMVGSPAPRGTGRLNAVACPTVTTCFAVGSPPPSAIPPSATASRAVVDVTKNAGLSWSMEKVVTSTPTVLNSISCPTAKSCIAVGSTAVPSLAGVVVRTLDGGKRWQQISSPSGAVNLVSAECLSKVECLALATDGTTYWTAVTRSLGTSWQQGGNLPAGISGVSRLSCSSADLCIATGFTPSSPAHGVGAIAVSSDGGASWSSSVVPGGTGIIHDATCAGPRSCVAVGTMSTTTSDVALGKGAILTSGTGATTWTAAGSPIGLDDGFGVSCFSGGDCIAVGTVWTPTVPPTPVGAAVMTTNSGRSWTTLEVRYVPNGLVGLSCPSRALCVAVGGGTVARLSATS